VVFGDVVGLIDAVPSPDEGLDLGGRKNEPILSGIVGEIALFVHFENLGGVHHLAPFVFTAFGLDLAELLQSTVEQAREALLVNVDVGERVALVVEGLRLGDRRRYGVRWISERWLYSRRRGHGFRSMLGSYKLCS
jgi:hypothetical protein